MKNTNQQNSKAYPIWYTNVDDEGGIIYTTNFPKDEEFITKNA